MLDNELRENEDCLKSLALIHILHKFLCNGLHSGKFAFDFNEFK